MNDTARLRLLSAVSAPVAAASHRGSPLARRLREAARRRQLERDFADTRAELHRSRAPREALAEQLGAAIEQIEQLQRELDRARRKSGAAA